MPIWIVDGLVTWRLIYGSNFMTSGNFFIYKFTNIYTWKHLLGFYPNPNRIIKY
jgi:hypothetical protein